MGWVCLMFSPAQLPAEVTPRTDEANLTTPVTSLSSQDTQWIHVEKLQQKTSGNKVSIGSLHLSLKKNHIEAVLGSSNKETPYVT